MPLYGSFDYFHRNAVSGLVLSTMKNDDAAQGILDIFSSFITDEISDFNSNVYYTNPDYLRCSYLEAGCLPEYGFCTDCQ